MGNQVEFSSWKWIFKWKVDAFKWNTCKESCFCVGNGQSNSRGRRRIEWRAKTKKQFFFQKNFFPFLDSVFVLLKSKSNAFSIAAFLLLNCVHICKNTWTLINRFEAITKQITTNRIAHCVLCNKLERHKKNLAIHSEMFNFHPFRIL